MPITLIVDHLPLHTSEDELRSLFRPFGPLSAVRVVRAGRTQSLAFGFVELETVEQASSAVLSLNGTEIGGHRITVALAEEPSPAPAKSTT